MKGWSAFLMNENWGWVGSEKQGDKDEERQDWPINKRFSQGDFKKFTIEYIVQMPIFDIKINRRQCSDCSLTSRRKNNTAKWRLWCHAFHECDVIVPKTTNTILSVALCSLFQRWVREIINLREAWRRKGWVSRLALENVVWDRMQCC